eukprot:CAMPEP_0117651406 /NCGR_PEP_ID=MMETSP0804-20121206/2075_1 /TAXON_ID=1074897 /ORGANISM="Tetraselmis astigmatica, Strain CCMP880" /LENGTH=121 /DNA_ID=CAMNT_0005457381 /DNA_START=263 /DNA_END=628 /DNA_ORIENTATION=+
MAEFIQAALGDRPPSRACFILQEEQERGTSRLLVHLLTLHAVLHPILVEVVFLMKAKLAFEEGASCRQLVGLAAIIIPARNYHHKGKRRARSIEQLEHVANIICHCVLNKWRVCLKRPLGG